MKWYLYSVGHARGDDLEGQVQDYARRIARRMPLEVRVFSDEDAMDRAIGNRMRIVLTEHGVQPDSSEALARRIGRLMTHENRDVVFVVGGAHGHSESFLQKAHERWSLSNLTFPHRLARLMLVEQLYRALTILHNEPYHH